MWGIKARNSELSLTAIYLYIRNTLFHKNFQIALQYYLLPF